MGTHIKIYRGHQIGGCVTVIRTDKTKIVIDFGENLPGNDNTEELTIEGLTYGTPDVDAVFFTHYHGDHIWIYTGLSRCFHNNIYITLSCWHRRCAASTGIITGN